MSGIAFKALSSRWEVDSNPNDGDLTSLTAKFKNFLKKKTKIRKKQDIAPKKQKSSGDMNL